MMGEGTPDDPPSGDCPDCVDDLPLIIPMEVELPDKGRTFVGQVGLVCDAGQCFFTHVAWCRNEGRNADFTAWGGWLLGCVYHATGTAYHCWPYVTGTDIPGCPGLGPAIFRIG